MSGNPEQRLNLPNHRILIIDDNESIHADFRKILIGKPREVCAARAAFFDDEPDEPALPTYEIDSAFQGAEGFERAMKADQEGRPYSMAFVDVRMPPGWDGIKTIQHLWEKQPELQAVLCTAYSDYSWTEMTQRLGQSDRLLILKKPFDVIEVRQLACALTEKWVLARQARMKIDELEVVVAERTANLAEVNRQLESEIEARRNAESHFRQVVELCPYAVLMVNQQGKIELVNSETEQLFDYGRAELIGQPVELLIPERFRARHAGHVAEFLGSNRLPNGPLPADFVGLCKDGREVPVQIRLKRLETSQGTFALSALMDISERKQMEEQLRHDATHDALTNLPNRALLLVRLEQSLQRTQRRAPYNFAVLFLDLDRFKNINDSLGHLIGDKLLIAAARRIQSCLRPEDMLARIGGDEFSILLDDMNDQNGPIRVAQRILEEFKKPFEIDGEQLVTTTSIGITFSSMGYYRAEDILRDADTAMYEAKADGKECFRVFDQGMHQRAKSMLVLENELRRAVEQREFLCQFQPIVSLQDGRVVAFETLLRWQHPHRGLLLPDEFLEVAENLGLIIPIGRDVILNSFRQLKSWKSVCDEPFSVHINISPRQLAEKSLMQQINEAVRSTGIDPADVCLEITEDAVLENSGIVADRLEQLKKMGFLLQVDDFGTGYASLSYLYRFPFSALKIDRSFISGRAGSAPNWQIAESIIRLAHNLNMTVVAEGIETEEQLARLQVIGCDLGQGFLFNAPMDEQTALSLLQNPRPLLPAPRLV